jgi:hypothetical protein
VTDTFLETVTFTATVNGITLSQHPTVQFVSDLPLPAASVASPTTVNANGSDTTTITVTLQDANGNPSPNKSVNLSQGNGASIITADHRDHRRDGEDASSRRSRIKPRRSTYTAVDVTDGNLPVPAAPSSISSTLQDFLRRAMQVGTAAPGYAVTTFASNFLADCFSSQRPHRPRLQRQRHALSSGIVNDNASHAFGPQGGIAGRRRWSENSAGVRVQLAGLTFTKDGRLYAGMTTVAIYWK